MARGMCFVPSYIAGLLIVSRARQHLDLYYPTAISRLPPMTANSRSDRSPGTQSVAAYVNSLTPTVLFIHGGAWAWGHKWQYSLIGQVLAACGFTVGVMNYTVYPYGTCDDMVEDVMLAIDYLHHNCVGADVHNIHLIGHSAGAHLAALTAVQAALMAHDNEVAEIVCKSVSSVIGLSGVYDIADHFIHESKRVVKLGPFQMRGVHHISPMLPAMGGQENFDNYSPAKLVRTLSEQQLQRLPTFALVHGAEDTVRMMPAGCANRSLCHADCTTHRIRKFL